MKRNKLIIDFRSIREGLEEDIDFLGRGGNADEINERSFLALGAVINAEGTLEWIVQDFKRGTRLY